MTDLFIKVKVQQQQQLPFVLYCKPNSDRIVGLFQKNDHLYFLETFEENGFVFAPFDADEIPYIPTEYADVYVETVKNSHYFFDDKLDNINGSVGKDFFEELVVKALKSIQNKEFQKVVLSRKEEITIQNFDLEMMFKKMIQLYSNAFKYCFFHPKIGTWIGATPEQFLKTDSNLFKTVALAGTQLATSSKKIIWQNKEEEEQQLVTDFIRESLEDLVKQITISTPYSEKAGNMWHIKSDISATLKSKKSLKKVIAALHPTPAVCGLPKHSAKNFIRENEGYKREYYSGFLGEMNINFATFRTQQTDLFVNLRCMKIVDKSAELFVGCGITKDSIPEDEYKETVMKSMTMRRVL